VEGTLQRACKQEGSEQISEEEHGFK
jgi:hypothetical protein